MVPDLLFVSRDRAGIMTEKNSQGPPALVVEVLSPSTRRRDKDLKRRLFDLTGVRECWMVDPKTDTVTIYRRAAETDFDPPLPLTSASAGVLVTSILPGFSLPLLELFR